jgi:glycosyltransferase involved in cell wall biosynthesis
LREILSSSGATIAQTHSIKSHFLMRLSGEWKRLPWIAFHHGYTQTNRRLLFYNQLDRWSLRAPRRIVVVSRSFARDLVSKGIPEERITVMHNAIDPKWGELAHDAGLRARTRAALGLEENEKAVLIIGRLSLEKSHVLLVEAVSRLRELLPQTPVRLLIVGEGPERSAIEQAAQSLGISDKVHFTGYTRDVLPYYAAADLAVLASLSEGSPNALLEAMVARVPVVATSVGGIPEIVHDRQSALLVPPADVAALTAALAQALGDPTLCQALAARAHEEILAHYTPELRAASLYQLYVDIAGANQGGAG